jgi:hypothetical protein
VIEAAGMKKPGAVSRLGAAREFQFQESTDLGIGVKQLKRQVPGSSHGLLMSALGRFFR